MKRWIILQLSLTINVCFAQTWSNCQHYNDSTIIYYFDFDQGQQCFTWDTINESFCPKTEIHFRNNSEDTIVVQHTKSSSSHVICSGKWGATIYPDSVYRIQCLLNSRRTGNIRKSALIGFTQGITEKSVIIRFNGYVKPLSTFSIKQGEEKSEEIVLNDHITIDSTSTKEKHQNTPSQETLILNQKLKKDSTRLFSYYPKLKPIRVNLYNSGNLRMEIFVWSYSSGRYHDLHFAEQVRYADTNMFCPLIRNSSSFDMKIYTYENCTLVSKKVILRVSTLSSELERLFNLSDYNYRIEKGTFVYERLQKGVVEFYNDSAELIRTEVVTDSYKNAKELVFHDKILFQRLLRHYPSIDLDQNGIIDTYEADQVRFLGFTSKGTKSLDELKYFKNLIKYFDYDVVDYQFEPKIPDMDIMTPPNNHTEHFIIEE